MSLTPQQTWLNGGIGQIELGSDEDNATFDEPSLLALRNGFEALAADPGVERIVLCGRRERFVSGVDVSFFIQSLTAGQVDRIISFTYSAHSILNIIARCPKPVVAWIDGPAFGAGLELALACHRIVAGPKARFCLPETGLGIYPGMGGTQRLPRKIGVGLAKWMIYTGSIAPAEHAWQFGLVDALAPAGAAIDAALAALDSPAPRPPLEPRFRNLAELFTARNVDALLDPSLTAPADPQSVRALVQTRSAAPQALRLAERAIDRGIALPLDAGLEEETAHLAEVFSTSDALLGLSSLGKGRPKFTGT